MIVVTTAKKINKNEISVTIPKEEYRSFLRWRKRSTSEIDDVNDSIKVFQEEKKNGTLKLIKS